MKFIIKFGYFLSLLTLSISIIILTKGTKAQSGIGFTAPVVVQVQVKSIVGSVQVIQEGLKLAKKKANVVSKTNRTLSKGKDKILEDFAK